MAGKTKQVKEVKTNDKKVELEYSVSAYCNIIGATDSIRYVARLKFKGVNRKTVRQWKESFKKEALI